MKTSLMNKLRRDLIYGMLSAIQFRTLSLPSCSLKT
jgi:hypothetical protein